MAQRYLVEKGITVDEEEDILYNNESGSAFTEEQLKKLKKEFRETI